MKLSEIEVRFEHNGQSFCLVVECPAIVVARFFRVTGNDAEEVTREALREMPVWSHVRNTLAALRRAFPGGVV